jgi:hypothetical protein
MRFHRKIKCNFFVIFQKIFSKSVYLPHQMKGKNKEEQGKKRACGAENASSSRSSLLGGMDNVRSS